MEGGGGAAHEAGVASDSSADASGIDATRDAASGVSEAAVGDSTSEAGTDAANEAAADAANEAGTDAANEVGADAANDAGGCVCQSLQIPAGGGAVVSGSASVLPAGNACYEAWVRTDGSHPAPIYLSACTSAGDCNMVLEYRSDLGLIRFAVQAAGQALLSADYAHNPNDNQWHHVAGCRAVSGGAVTLNLFWDGQPVATASGSTASIGAPTDLRLGSITYATTDGLGGYIDEVRVSDTIRYAAAFTPATRFASDGSTKVLLHFDTVTTTTFVDSSSSSLGGSLLGTAAAATVCVPNSCLATSTCYAMRIDQTNANVSAPSTGWGLGTGDWTLEAWIKAHDAFTGGVIFVLNESYLTNEVRFLYDNTTGKVGCSTYSGSCPCGKGTGNLSLASGAINNGAWHHVACVRTGGTGKLYVDGAQVDSDIITTSMVPASGIAFGQPSGYPSYTAAPVVVGPLRFSNVARYTGPFTPLKTWSVDSSTLTQYLVSNPFTGTLIDEAGGDNTSTSASGVSASSDTPCP